MGKTDRWLLSKHLMKENKMKTSPPCCNSIREKLCEAIVSLDLNAAIDDVENKIGPLMQEILESSEVIGNEGSQASSVGVTPLMIACDQGQLRCLAYFAAKYEAVRENCKGDASEMIMMKIEQFSRIVGECMQSSAADGNNQAIHYSTSSPEAVLYLSRIMMSQNHSLSQSQASFQLLSQVNDHGDTPLMMAAANGNKRCLKYWMDLISDIDSIKVKEVLTMTNHSNDNVLSLAYGLGNHDVVEHLVSTNDEDVSLIQVTYEDLQRIKVILKNMSTVESRVPVNRIQEFKERQRNIQRCLVLMQSASEKYSEHISDLLIKQHEIEPTSKAASTLKKKSKKRKKKKKQVPSNSDIHVKIAEAKASCEMEDTRRHTTQNLNVAPDSHDQKDYPVTKPKFATMEDGTVVSDESKSLSATSSRHMNMPKRNDEKSIQLLLKERCNDIIAQRSEEVMESLCLDASMLLLSPHALAMNLSPSQLEAVETVLRNQLEAVSQAKHIHERLMAPSEDEGSQNK